MLKELLYDCFMWHSCLHIPIDIFFFPFTKQALGWFTVYEQSLAVLSSFPTELLPGKWFSHLEGVNYLFRLQNCICTFSYWIAAYLLQFFGSQVQCMKIVMLMPSSTVFVAPPSLALLVKVNKTTPNIQNLHENVDQKWNQDLHKSLAIGYLGGRLISLLLHTQHSVILFLLYLWCNTCNGSERQCIFPNSQIYCLICWETEQSIQSFMGYIKCSSH